MREVGGFIPTAFEPSVGLSIVSTLYRSAPYLAEFHEAATSAALTHGGSYEIVLVNDGSPDDVLAIAASLVERDAHVRVIDLSRNFGHHRAMMIGLSYARGKLVFLIDCDLEISPLELSRFHAAMLEHGADVVYGVQDVRRDSFLTRLGSAVFYAVFNLLSSVRVQPNLVTTRIMSSRYVQALIQHREREIMIAGLWANTGFQQLPIPVTKSWKGTSSYSLAARAAHLFDAVISFSSRPLVAICYVGLSISVLAAVAIICLVAQWVFFGGFLAGWASVIATVGFLGGLNLVCLGIIGIYLSKIFIETKQRPYAIVRQVLERVEGEHAE